MSMNFRFQRAENFDHSARTWHVTHKKTGFYVGEVRSLTAGNYEVRRPSDGSFHGTHANRVEAARWLKDRLGSTAVFEDDSEPSDESDDSN